MTVSRRGLRFPYSGPLKQINPRRLPPEPVGCGRAPSGTGWRRRAPAGAIRAASGWLAESGGKASTPRGESLLLIVATRTAVCRAHPESTELRGDYLNATTVHDDGAGNDRESGDGLDWFFANLDGVGNNGVM